MRNSIRLQQTKTMYVQINCLWLYKTICAFSKTNFSVSLFFCCLKTHKNKAGLSDNCQE